MATLELEPVGEALDLDADEPAVRAFLRGQAADFGAVGAAISPDDEMFSYTLDDTGGQRRLSLITYLASGRGLFDSLDQVVAWYFGGFDRVGRFLDFAAGYGRSTRYLVRRMPPERVWVCDIYERAVDFQRQRHGVRGAVSVSDPAAFPPPGLPGGGQFDCVFASSFFSHMPESTFTTWLGKLYGLVAPGGMLAFSAIDMGFALFAEGAERPEFLFQPKSESQSLDKEEYGLAYVTERFVREACRRALPAHVAVHRVPRALDYFQDLYIVADDPARDASRLAFAHHPRGSLDGCWLEPYGALRLSGWAADPNPGGGIEDIQMIVDGRVVQRCLPSHPRADVAAVVGPYALQSAWMSFLSADEVGLDEVVMIKAVNARGLERVVFCDTLRPVLRRP